MNKKNQRLGITSLRTKNIVKHIGLSDFYKDGTIIINFLLVQLAVSNLENASYGIWLTLSYLIGWFSFFDLELGKGFRKNIS